MMSIPREVVVITGASAGPDGLEAVRIEVEDAGGRALVLPTDVADADAVEAAASAVGASRAPGTQSVAI